MQWDRLNGGRVMGVWHMPWHRQEVWASTQGCLFPPGDLQWFRVPAFLWAPPVKGKLLPKLALSWLPKSDCCKALFPQNPGLNSSTATGVVWVKTDFPRCNMTCMGKLHSCKWKPWSPELLFLSLVSSHSANSKLSVGYFKHAEDEVLIFQKCFLRTQYNSFMLGIPTLSYGLFNCIWLL